MARRIAAVAGVAGALATVYAIAVRPRMLRSGATREEVEQPYPGADLMPGAERGATMATTIDAPPEQVWPWLLQMGYDRGGWYSFDRLDHAAIPSAERIHPEWQDVAVGDRMMLTADGNHWFEVAALQPRRFLALRASFDFRGRPLPPTGRWPRVYNDSLWCFQLKELPGGRTRLVVGGYAGSQPRWLRRAMAFAYWEPAHWIMQKRQFRNLRRRAERGRAPVPVDVYVRSGT